MNHDDERQPDGKVHIIREDTDVTEQEAAAFADQLQSIAERRQLAVERVQAAREKRAREAAHRAASHG